MCHTFLRVLHLLSPCEHPSVGQWCHLWLPNEAGVDGGIGLVVSVQEPVVAIAN